MSKLTQIDIAVKNVKSPINVITYSQLLHFVAVGRHDGIVEIYDASQNFLLLAKIIISNINPIDGLKFMNFKHGVNLFGISSSKLFEIDLSKNYVKQEIFFLSSNYARSIVQAIDKIVVGCDGGYIHIYDYMSEIKFLRTIHNAGESILSLAFSKTMKDYLFAGSQGRMYKINLSTNNADYYDLIKEKNRSATYIWCLEFVGKYLCSGDSKGVVTIWNTETLGVLQSFVTHKADVLTIAVGVNCLFASGSDPQLVKLELDGDKWTEGAKRFGMIGDVRSLCCTDNKLIAGGLNCNLLVYDIHPNQNDRSDKHSKIEDLSPLIEIHSFDADRTIIFTEISKSVRIYELNTKSRTKNLIRTVKPPNESHLQAWSASKSLKYLAYSTNTETRVLKMQFSDNKKTISVDLKRFNALEFSHTYKAEGQSLCLPPSYLLKFIEMNSRTYLLLVESFVTNCKSDNNSKLFIYEIIENSTKPILITSILAKEENYFNNVQKIEISDNGELIAFSTLDGLLFIYSLEKLAIVKKVARQVNPNKKDIPRVVCMRFNSEATSLVAIYSNKKIWKLDVSKNKADKWFNNFNSNLRKEWMYLCPRDVHFIDDQKILVLMTKGLVVQINVEKTAVVPSNVPLFNKRKIAKQVKEKTIRVEIAQLTGNMRKMTRIIEQLKPRNDEEMLKPYEKRLIRYQEKIKKLQSVDVDTTAETCFTWDFVKKDTMTLKYLPEQSRFISVSLEEPDQNDFTYRKKFFGL